MSSLWQDLRFGARSLRRSPASTVLALLTLTLCIGANTAIFTVVDAVLLAPLPFPHPEQLVVMSESAPKLGFPKMNCSPVNFNDWRARNQVFSSLMAYRRGRYTLTGSGGEPEVVAGAVVTGDFFRTLGVTPVAGRLLQPVDDRPGAEKTVVLADALWHRRYGGDPGILHRRITINGSAYSVVGIAPATLQLPGKSQLWVALALDYAKERRLAHWVGVMGRLRPGMSLARAQAGMSAVAAQLARQYPADDADWGVILTSFREVETENVRPALTMLQLAVWLVLLIGCVNVASLGLARLTSRESEIAIRAALGAGRRRLARQIVAENLLLGVAGGALGLAIAQWGTRALIALNPDAIPHAEAIGVDWRVLAYALLVSAGTGAVCGLAPALAATGRQVYGTLRQGGRGIAGGRRGMLARRVLVGGEVALALALLVGAGVLLRSFARLQAVDPGFKAQGVIAARVTLPAAKYPDPVRQAAFFQQALQRIAALPGVKRAGAIDALPLAESGEYIEIAAEGRPREPGENHSGHSSLVSSDYFSVMRIKLLAGRGFSERDDLRSVPVTILNRFAADRLWPGQDPLGRRVTFGQLPTRPDATWWTVVGLVGDVRDTDLAQQPEVEVYIPQLQLPAAKLTLVVRDGDSPQGLVGPIRRTIQALDPDLPLDRVQSLDEVVSSALAGKRVRTSLLGILAALALALALVGVYGLVSYAVGERVHEIGIRMALGAQGREVVRMMVRQGMRLVAAGLALGLAGGYAFSRLLAGQLYQAEGVDAWTYAGAALILAACAWLASWLPARRAIRVDALEALRQD